ncbi:putative Phytocyanin domain, cupredoxin [Helianthus annuus]|uniref:Phytocyanin domain, cupredoxin n=1 Tax=Helianthus annuus TaxID=4232 RepID=A0A251UI29_HELAN|nr:blue copper protein 1a [Helianthus annuus]KAF5802432.1 putative Phytocyanin domain, cupredoxin [Helianthus annuus]KAJ0560560.1 putative Phytocyanin domain, cupredoxin [Helianthus annuus]KAJ0566930.1 putative Phytocyanin domain, cupredoxin [Helianthus annuus]KAJ0573589.1 putative Phytocyanin domain, cupredoxin [Helianthus annuus]KAJ0737952.1 putative Phytocyanin domain, cupredoxin [Helianthus annuus]
MARKLWSIFIILIATTVAEEVKHTVHNINWSAGANAREKARDIRVGDTLIFRYKAGEHDLIEVDKDSYDKCIVPPSAKIFTTGKDALFVHTPGPKYFICGFPQHCKDRDMKLQIEVRDQSDPKLQIDDPNHRKLESTPGPTQPELIVFVVGDDKGWNENVDFEAWAKGKEFYMGDFLAFNYTVGKHNVLGVDEAAFNECTIPKDQNEALSSGKDQVRLLSMGKLGFISGIGKDCENGMKLLINVKCPHTRPKPPALQGGRKLVPSI